MISFLLALAFAAPPTVAQLQAALAPRQEAYGLQVSSVAVPLGTLEILVASPTASGAIDVTMRLKMDLGPMQALDETVERYSARGELLSVRWREDFVSPGEERHHALEATRRGKKVTITLDGDTRKLKLGKHLLGGRGLAILLARTAESDLELDVAVWRSLDDAPELRTHTVVQRGAHSIQGVQGIAVELNDGKRVTTWLRTPDGAGKARSEDADNPNELMTIEPCESIETCLSGPPRSPAAIEAVGVIRTYFERMADPEGELDDLIDWEQTLANSPNTQADLAGFRDEMLSGRGNGLEPGIFGLLDKVAILHEEGDTVTWTVSTTGSQIEFKVQRQPAGLRIIAVDVTK